MGCVQFVQLSNHHKTKRMGSALIFLTQYYTDGDAFVDCILTSDATTPSQEASANHLSVIIPHHPKQKTQTGTLIMKGYGNHFLGL